MEFDLYIELWDSTVILIKKTKFSIFISVWKVSIFGVFLDCISRIRTEYRDSLRKSPYSIRKQENTDQKKSKYGHFPHSLYGMTYKATLSLIQLQSSMFFPEVLFIKKTNFILIEFSYFYFWIIELSNLKLDKNSKIKMGKNSIKMNFIFLIKLLKKTFITVFVLIKAKTVYYR